MKSYTPSAEFNAIAAQDEIELASIKETVADNYPEVLPDFKPLTPQFIETSELEASGTVNKVTYFQAQSSQCAHGDEVKSRDLRVARTDIDPKEKPYEDRRSRKDRLTRDVRNTFIILRKYQVKHPYLYHDRFGVKIAELGEDYFNFIVREQDKHNSVKVKNYIGQLVLIVDDLHSHSIVHRDIKPENMLLFDDSLVAIDYDQTQEVDARGRFTQNSSTFMATPGYAAPELDLDSLEDLDSFAIDCYALGASFITTLSLYKNFSARVYNVSAINLSLDTTIYLDTENPRGYVKDLLALLPQRGESLTDPNVVERKNLYDMIASLLQRDPVKRARTADLMNHPYFGATKEEREKFFAELRKKEYQLTIDGYRVPFGQIKSGDNFYLMPPAIKPILYSAATIDKAMQKCKAMLVAATAQASEPEVAAIKEQLKMTRTYVAKLNKFQDPTGVDIANTAITPNMQSLYSFFNRKFPGRSLEAKQKPASTMTPSSVKRTQ